MKEVVRFFSLVCNQPEKIPVTQNLKKAVRSAYAAYKEWVEKEKEEEEKKEKRLDKGNKSLRGHKKKERD